MTITLNSVNLTGGDDVQNFQGQLSLTVHAGGGHDWIRGTGTRDNIQGGTGDDTVRGDHGEDTIAGGAGDDDLAGEGSNDKIFGNSGNDLLDGGSDNDTLIGGGDDDTLIGGNGNDLLMGDTGGKDIGADHFVFDNDDGNDQVIGFGSRDTIELTDGFGYDLSYNGFTTTLTYGETTVRFAGSEVSHDQIEVTGGPDLCYAVSLHDIKTKGDAEELDFERKFEGIEHHCYDFDVA